MLLKVQKISTDHHQIQTIILGIDPHSPVTKKLIPGQILTFERSLHTNRWLLHGHGLPHCSLSFLEGTKKKLLEYQP